MKEEIRREESRNLESFVTRLERMLSKPTVRQHKIGNDTGNNVAGEYTKHIPNFSTSSMINSQLWKNSGSQNNE